MLWNKYTFPFRPSKKDIKNYFSGIDSNKKILLLGATPEIREIFSKNSSKITVADFSIEMMEEMTKLGYKINKNKEEWIKIDWLNLDKFFEDNYFDFILGDLVLRNIETKYQSKFLNKISRLLNKEGIFITRIHCFNKKMINFKSENIIKNAFKKYSVLKSKLIEDLITSRLFDKNTNLKNKKINKEKFTNDIYNYLNNKTTSKREKVVLENILKKWRGKRTWVQNTKEELEKMFLDSFYINKNINSGDYIDSEFYPVYKMKKRCLE